MSLWLKQSTAATVKLGPFVDDTDGKTAETGLTIAQADIRLSKNGGDFAQTNNAAGATHDENGYYDVPLNTTDTNTLGTLTVAVSKTGALPVWATFMVVPANVYDSLFGADNLQVDVVQVSGTAQTARDVGAQLDAAVSTRLAATDYTAPDNTSITAIKAKTDNLPASPAATGDIPTAAAIRAEVDSNSVDINAILGYVDELETRLTTARAAKLDGLPSIIKKNTALANFPFKMFNADGSPGTGLTVSAARSLDGAAFGSCANAVVEVGGGIYKINLAAADLNGDTVALQFTAAGAKQTDIVLVTNS